MKKIIILLFLAGLASAQYVDADFGNLGVHGTMFSDGVAGQDGYLIDTSDSTFNAQKSIFGDYYSALTLPQGEWIKYVEVMLRVNSSSPADTIIVQLQLIEMNADSSFVGANPRVISSSSSCLLESTIFEPYVFEWSPAFKVPSEGLYGLYVNATADTTRVLDVYGNTQAGPFYQMLSRITYNVTNDYNADFYARFWCPSHTVEFNGNILISGSPAAGTTVSDFVISPGDTISIVCGVITKLVHP